MRKVLAYLIINGIFLSLGLEWGQNIVLDVVLGLYYVSTSLWLAFIVQRVFRFNGDAL